jgi:hypothetical protein
LKALSQQALHKIFCGSKKLGGLMSQRINLHELKLKIGFSLYQEYFIEITLHRNKHCPFHDDNKTKSFSIFLTESGEYWFKCFGCGVTGDTIYFFQLIKNITKGEAIRQLNDRFNGGISTHHDSHKHSKDSSFTLEQIKKFVLNGTYPYNRHHVYDAASPLYLKVIYKDSAGNNTALFYHQAENDKWQKGMGGEAVLYNQNALEKRPHDIVMYPEGEKDADTLIAMGYLAITAGGTTAFKPSMAEKLKERDVVLFADNDESGYKSIDIIAGYILPVAKSVAIADLTTHWLKLFQESMPEKADITDLVEKYKDVYGNEGLKDVIDDIIKNAKPVESENIDIGESEEQESITDEKLLPVTPFPFDVFSEELQNLIDKISHCYQVEPSMVASVMLPLVGGAVGNAIRVSPKKGWNESPFIWMAIIADTGHGKSPVIKALTKPIIHAQGEAQQEYQDELADYEADLKKFNCLNKNEQVSQKTPTKPILRHYMVSDSTVEALGCVFEVTPRGVNIIWDELSGWLNSLNQYKTKAGNDRQHFLSLWNPEPWKIDRKITGSKFIQNTGASILGGIQPRIIPKVLGNEGFDDGFIPRFLLLHTESVNKRFTKEGIDETDLMPWNELIAFCYSQRIELSHSGFVQPKLLILSEDALNNFEDFYNHCYSIAPYLSLKAKVFPPKLISYNLRLMGVIHVIDSFSKGQEITPVVEPEITEKAARLTKFYAGQAIKALRLYGKAEEELDEYQKRLIETLYKLRNEVERGKLPLSRIVEVVNDELPESVKYTNEKVSRLIKEFGLETKKSTGNRSVLIWEEMKVKKLFSKITVTSVTSVITD